MRNIKYEISVTDMVQNNQLYGNLKSVTQSQCSVSAGE